MGKNHENYIHVNVAQSILTGGQTAPHYVPFHFDTCLEVLWEVCESIKRKVHFFTTL